MTSALETIPSPATSHGAVERSSRSVASVLRAARVAQAHWAVVPLARRLETLRRLRALIARHATLLAQASADPRSRPVAETLSAEVAPLAEACRFLERHAEKILAPQRLGRRGLPLWLTGVTAEIHREALGVILVIGPGNYPLLIPGVQVIQAVIAGNAALIKPGLGGSGPMRLLSELMARAGFDPDLVAVLPEETEAAQAAIAAGPDKVVFTGSAETGGNILAQLAPRLIPAAMELSGCDAAIVRADADLDLVAQAVRFALTLNTGATCLAPHRLFAHRSIAANLEKRLGSLFDTKTTTPGLPISTPLRALISDAQARGARVIAEGPDGAGPVILASVAPGSRLLREDAFGPVLALVSVESDDEAIFRANDCPFGLTASIFSRDEATARRVAQCLRVGTVTINDMIIPTADARVPFGGRKQSGFGVTRGAEGLLELTAPKVITVSRSPFRPGLEAPRSSDAALFQLYLTVAHGRGLAQRGRALAAMAGHLLGRRNARKERPS